MPCADGGSSVWILIVVGLILLVLGTLDRAAGPRRYYW